MEEVFTEVHLEERRTVPVLLADELDRAPGKLDRARGGADVAGEPGCPGAEPGEVQPGEPGRVGHRGPQREGPLKVRVGLREAEDRLGLACGFGRGCERLGRAARRRPVRREFGRPRRPAARELRGKARVQLLALPREDGRVDRLRQQRMAEPEAPRLRLSGQDAALHGRAERVAQGAVRQVHGRAEQRIPDLASGRRGQAQHGLRRVIEAGDALQQQVAQCLRQLNALPARRGEKLFGKEGVALRAGGDRFCHGRGQRSAGAGREQRRQLVAFERTELEHERRAGAPGPIR